MGKRKRHAGCGAALSVLQRCSVHLQQSSLRKNLEPLDRNRQRQREREREQERKRDAYKVSINWCLREVLDSVNRVHHALVAKVDPK